MSKCEICEEREATTKIEVCDVCRNELIEKEELLDEKIEKLERIEEHD